VAGPGFLNMHDQVSAVTTSVLCDRAGMGLERGRLSDHASWHCALHR